MNYSKIKAEDKLDNTINLYKISDYAINNFIISLHLKSGSIRELIYENNEKAREKYNYFLKLENKELKRAKKERKRIKTIDNMIY